MQEIFVPAIAISRGAVAPENKEVLWEDISNMSLPFFERIKSYDSNTTQWRMVTQLPLELLNSLKKVDGDGSGLDANFLQGRTVNDIIQLAKDGSFTLPNGFIFVGNNLGEAEAKALSGDATLQSNGNLTLASSGVTAGIYNLASLTIDAKGRITNAVSYTISVDDIPELPQSKITGLVTDLSNRELIANKENSLIDTSTTKYPTVNLLKIGLDGKQDTLVSGTNIKTLNGDSLLGSGNIEIISENLATNNLNLPAATNRTFTLPADSTLDFGALMKLFGTGIVDFTSDVTVDNVQFKGGTGTQGEMSWSTDEETVKLIMDGTTLYMGQDTFVHVRNNTASIITKGTAVYATGTLGASGRITVAPMIADGTIPGRLFIGLAAEDIAIGVDGQVITFGKIRQIDTTAYNDGDVLWLSPTVSGGLTATEPTAPNLKIATAFVIHAASNGTLMVRAEQGNDLHSDQRVQVSALTNNDVLTWDNTNQRWQNAQPVSENIGNTNLSIPNATTRTLTIPSNSTLDFSNLLKLFGSGNLTQILPSAYPADVDISIGHVAYRLNAGKVEGRYRVDVSNYLDISFGSNLEIYNGTDLTPLTAREKLRFKGYLEAVDDAGDSETEVDIASGSLAVANTSRFDLNGSGDVDLKIAQNKLLTGDINGFATELTVTTDSILGLDTNSEVVEYEVVEIYNILAQTGVIADGQLSLTDINGTSANLKAKFEINSIAIKNTTANGVTINIGSTALGTDVANNVVIAPNSISKIPLGTTFFSDTANTNLYISSSNWNSASININISIQKIWQ